MAKVQFLSLIERCQEKYIEMLLVEIVCCGSEDFMKHKYTMWYKMEFVIFWQALPIVKKTQR